MCSYNTAINCLELRKMIMATILIPPNTKCNQFSNNIPNQVVNYKTVSQVYNKRRMFLIVY